MRTLRYFLVIVVVCIPIASQGSVDRWLAPLRYYLQKPGSIPVYLVKGWRLGDKAYAPPMPRHNFQCVTLDALVAKDGQTPLSKPEGCPQKRVGQIADRQPLLTLDAVSLTPGTHLLTLDSIVLDGTWDGMRFQEYLVDEHLHELLKLRADTQQADMPVRVLYQSCYKTIIQIGPLLTDTAIRRVGQVLEIVLLQNPPGLKPGSTLSFKVLFEGRPLAGHVVVAVHFDAPIPEDVVTLTDAEGIAHVALRGPGKWLIHVVHLVPSKDPRGAWRHYAANLTLFLL